MNIHEWIEYGHSRGYCTDAYCDTHDGRFLTDEEAEQFEAGEDPCCYVLRLVEQDDE